MGAEDVVRDVGRPRARRSFLPYVYLLPALAVFGLFMFWPLVRSVILSVQGTDIIGRPSGIRRVASTTRSCSPTRTSSRPSA